MTKPAKYMLVNEIEKSLEPVEREASPAMERNTNCIQSGCYGQHQEIEDFRVENIQ
jgi:hypothetical protein